MNSQKISRNEPCPCGSGKKYKQCCGVTSTRLAPAFSASFEAAWNLFRQGFVEDAERIAREVLEADVKQAAAWHLLGSIALRQGQTCEAVEYGERGIRLNGKNPEFYNNLGLALHEMGQIAAAVTQYKKALALAPNYPDALFNLHAAMIDSNELSKSLQVLAKAVATNPRDLEARFMLGLLHDYSGESDKAATQFELIKHQPLYQARMDAWEYLKNAGARSIPVTGSAIDTFSHAMRQANNAGMVLEFGVRFGNSIRMLAKIAQQPVHGFDSFEGLPDVWHHEPKGSYTTKGVMPEVPENVTLHKGWFDQTLPEFLKKHTEAVRFINIDCDIYSSTKTVLDLLAPRIQPGSVLVFDEYIGNQHWREDEFKAFQETVARYGWRYEYLCFSFFTKQVAVKITQV
jgi:Tfp pilus assembly protein PilF